MRNTGRLLIDLNLVKINRQLTIALVIDIAPVIVCDARLTSIVVVLAVTITIIIVNTALRKIFTGKHGRFGPTKLILQMRVIIIFDIMRQIMVKAYSAFILFHFVERTIDAIVRRARLVLRQVHA